MHKTIEIDLDEILDDIDTDVLISELNRRRHDYNTIGVDPDQADELLESIYQLRRCQQPFDQELDLLIWHVLGRIQ